MAMLAADAMHPVFLCATCGTAFPASATQPQRCPICEDVRQYLPPAGQRWLSQAEASSRYRNVLRWLEPDLYSLRTDPVLAIGQRALLVRTPEGNVLWDCLSVLDDATATAIERLGGIAAIAISHPHYYSAQRRWSEAFRAPVYLHAADSEWVIDQHPGVHAWDSARLDLPGGLSLVQAGGHFPGATVLHWPAGAEGRGVLLTGDVLQVVPDRRVVAFMYSFPNHVPLPAWEVEAVTAAVEGLPFERIYGAFDGREITVDAKAAVARGRDQYLKALRGELPGLRAKPTLRR